MEFPVRVAFCKVLFWKNGGRFSATGLPVLEDQIRGSCDRAYDCGECSYLNDWIYWLSSQGWAWGWECDKCLRETKLEDARSAVERHVQGFFQSGRSGLGPGDPDFDPDSPTISGCTRCGFRETSFLQLVIRRK